MRRSSVYLSAAIAAVAAAFAAPAAQASTVTGPCAANPNALGTSRVVEIDTTGGPGFGFEHFRDHDFLKAGEVVLTFDDGPWTSTPAVLAALAQHCTKATFFPIGKHATYYPEILREVAKQGHSIGSHTWSHVDLSKMKEEQYKAEIEMGVAAVRKAVGDGAMPFFRFPQLKHPPEAVKYAGSRNIAIFSTDVDSFDFKLRKSDNLVTSVMDRLKKKGGGKGILLLHDFNQNTAKSVGDLLAQLKADGYKIVHMKAKTPIKSLPEYEAMVVAQSKGPQGLQAGDKPTSSVVKTVEGQQ